MNVHSFAVKSIILLGEKCIEMSGNKQISMRVAHHQHFSLIFHRICFVWLFWEFFFLNVIICFCCWYFDDDDITKLYIRSVQINSQQTRGKRINNIKHLHLGLTKISLKVCNWQSFREKLLWHSVQGENIIITFGCAFAQEKYLITEFMHVSFSATNIIAVVADVVVCLCVNFVRLEKYIVVFNNLAKYIRLEFLSAFFDESIYKTQIVLPICHITCDVSSCFRSRLHLSHKTGRASRALL